MTAARITEFDGTSPKWKRYAAGGPYDLLADSPTKDACCRKIVFLDAGSLTQCVGGDGVDVPLPDTMPAFWEHTGAVQTVTCSGAILVYW
jgi:hypothetical protein